MNELNMHQMKLALAPVFLTTRGTPVSLENVNAADTSPGFCVLI